MMRAARILEPAIIERLASPGAHPDLLQFLVDSSPDGINKMMPIVLKVLVFAAAVCYTSMIVSVNALYDMCSKPEYITALREEAVAAFQADSQSWQFSTLKHPKQLDSFMKESLRYNQPDPLGFYRKAEFPIKLSDPSEIPAGTYISVAAGPMSRDPTFYEDPNSFNPGGFYRHSAGKTPLAPPPEYEFTGFRHGNVVWGNGTLTCPGRWFVSAMNKLIIASFLIRYEIKFPEGQTERPLSVYLEGRAVPSWDQEILLRGSSRSESAHI